MNIGPLFCNGGGSLGKFTSSGRSLGSMNVASVSALGPSRVLFGNSSVTPTRTVCSGVFSNSMTGVSGVLELDILGEISSVASVNMVFSNNLSDSCLTLLLGSVSSGIPLGVGLCTINISKSRSISTTVCTSGFLGLSLSVYSMASSGIHSTLPSIIGTVNSSGLVGLNMNLAACFTAGVITSSKLGMTVSNRNTSSLFKKCGECIRDCVSKALGCSLESSVSGVCRMGLSESSTYSVLGNISLELPFLSGALISLMLGVPSGGGVISVRSSVEGDVLEGVTFSKNLSCSVTCQPGGTTRCKANVSGVLEGGIVGSAGLSRFL